MQQRHCRCRCTAFLWWLPPSYVSQILNYGLCFLSEGEGDQPGPNLVEVQAQKKVLVVKCTVQRKHGLVLPDRVSLSRVSQGTLLQRPHGNSCTCRHNKDEEGTLRANNKSTNANNKRPFFLPICLFTFFSCHKSYFASLPCHAIPPDYRFDLLVQNLTLQ